MVAAVERQGLVICDMCRTPVLRVVLGALQIESHHHGQKHVTRVPLQTLLDKMQAPDLE